MSRPESVERVMKWIGFAMSIKSHMIEEGLRDHHENCPFCEGGKVLACLAGGKNHLRVACSTDGCIRMME